MMQLSDGRSASGCEAAEFEVDLLALRPFLLDWSKGQ